MQKIVLDETLKARLNGLNEHLEFQDATGRTVGHFLPDDEYRRMIYDIARAEFDREAAEDKLNGVVRRWDGTNGMTTKEAIAYLEDLGRRGVAGQ